MNNWSVDLKQLKKHKKKYSVWKIEQMVNFGLGGKKLDEKQVKKYWPYLQLDPNKKKFIKLLLWS